MSGLYWLWWHIPLNQSCSGRGMENLWDGVWKESREEFGGHSCKLQPQSWNMLKPLCGFSGRKGKGRWEKERKGRESKGRDWGRWSLHGKRLLYEVAILKTGGGKANVYNSCHVRIKLQIIDGTESIINLFHTCAKEVWQDMFKCLVPYQKHSSATELHKEIQIHIYIYLLYICANIERDISC